MAYQFVAPPVRVVVSSCFLIALRLVVVTCSFVGLCMDRAQAQQDTDLQEVIVYANDFPPYIYKSIEGAAAGEWIPKIKALLDRTGLNYSIAVVPWSRAYTAGTLRDNVLIAHLDRTEEREELFHWLLPLLAKTNHLIARQDSEYWGLSLPEILESDGVAACVRLTIQCEMLRQLGFPENRIWVVEDFNGEPLSTLVLRGRVDFWLDNFEMSTTRLDHHELSRANFGPLFEVNTVISYLAASKIIHPRILDRISKAVADN